MYMVIDLYHLYVMFYWFILYFLVVIEGKHLDMRKFIYKAKHDISNIMILFFLFKPMHVTIGNK